MKTIEEIKKLLLEHKSALALNYNVKTIGVFGSYVRGEQRKRSDIDILVDFKISPDMIKFLDLEEYLSNVLGVKVDLVTRRALKPYIGKHILEEVVYV